MRKKKNETTEEDFCKKRNKPGNETTVKNLITRRENEFAQVNSK